MRGRKNEGFTTSGAVKKAYTRREEGEKKADGKGNGRLQGKKSKSIEGWKKATAKGKAGRNGIYGRGEGGRGDLEERFEIAAEAKREGPARQGGERRDKARQGRSCNGTNKGESAAVNTVEEKGKRKLSGKKPGELKGEGGPKNTASTEMILEITWGEGGGGGGNRGAKEF